jgi:ribonucleoside-diphosphate reductase alpha chain
MSAPLRVPSVDPREIARWDPAEILRREGLPVVASPSAEDVAALPAPDALAHPEGQLRLSPNAHVVLERRYLRKDADGRVVETPEQMLARVAGAIAAADAAYGEDPANTLREYLRVLGAFEFVPNSPTLMNAGRELGQLSACFTLPVEDSIAAIFDAVKWAAQIQMTGGGTGFSFSRLRPQGDLVQTTRGVASGPVAFIDVFNTATDAIKQGGARRGANMGVLRVDHPDILEFVTAKMDPRRWRNFNVSVAATDEFMQAVASDGEYALRNPRTGQVVRSLRARKVFDLIVHLAWRSAEPGLIFIDRINAVNPTPELGAMESTNPCAELPLLPFESCNLGSINVARFVRPGGFDYERMGAAVRTAVRFLDNVIEVNRYPLPQIETITRANRKIGLGVMGWADALIRLGVRYDSQEAVALAEELMRLVAHEALEESAALADRRGPFPNFRHSLWDRRGMRPVRNATVTAIAPTGTISIIAGCSSGIEPLYAVSYVRNVLEGTRLVEVHPLFRELALARGFYSESLMRRIAETGRVTGVAGVPEDVQRLFVTAYDVAAEWHVRMQAAFQKHCDNAVSKTVNLPHGATVGEVANVYRLAYEAGCKGITVYRDGSRYGQVLQVGEPVTDTEDHARCPDCGAVLSEGEGCWYCLACGWSRCG